MALVSAAQPARVQAPVRLPPRCSWRRSSLRRRRSAHAGTACAPRRRRPQGEARHDHPRGARCRPAALLPVVEAAHDADAPDDDLDSSGGTFDLDPAHDRDAVDDHLAVREARLPQVDLAAAQIANAVNLSPHRPAALALEPADRPRAPTWTRPSPPIRARPTAAPSGCGSFTELTEGPGAATPGPGRSRVIGANSPYVRAVYAASSRSSNSSMSSRPSARASRSASATRSRSASEARSSGRSSSVIGSSLRGRSSVMALSLRGRRHRASPGDGSVPRVHPRRSRPRCPAPAPTGPPADSPAAIRATSGAADCAAGNASHCRGPSTFTTRAPTPRSIGGSSRSRSTTRVRSLSPTSCSPASAPSYISRPWSMTITRLHSCSMSVRSCVVSSTVVPRSAFSSRRNSAHPGLADHVEPDRRLVQVEHLGVVQQRRRDVAAHPLPERQLPHRHVQQRAQIEEFDAAGPGSPGNGRPGCGTCGASAGTSRSAAGPTTASCAARTPPRSGGPAASAPATDRCPRPAAGRRSA